MRYCLANHLLICVVVRKLPPVGSFFWSAGACSRFQTRSTLNNGSLLPLWLVLPISIGVPTCRQLAGSYAKAEQAPALHNSLTLRNYFKVILHGDSIRLETVDHL